MPHRIQRHSALKTQGFVIRALFKRQMITRFGKYRLGAVWMLIDPLMSVIVLGVILGPLIGRSSGEIPYPFFLLCGFMQLMLVTSTMNSSAQALTSNQGLLIFRQVQPFDAFASRFLFELFSISFSLMFFCIVASWIGISMATDQLIAFVGCILISWLLGCGLGLILGIASLRISELEKVVTYIQRPLLFVSAILYPISAIPGQYREFLLWNPLVHTVEYSRKCLFHDYNATDVNMLYPAFVALICLSLGMMTYRKNRHFLTQR